MLGKGVRNRVIMPPPTTRQSQGENTPPHLPYPTATLQKYIEKRGVATISANAPLDL